MVATVPARAIASPRPLIPNSIPSRRVRPGSSRSSDQKITPRTPLISSNSQRPSSKGSQRHRQVQPRSAASGSQRWMKPPTPESHTNKIQLLAHREQPKPKPTGITEGRKLLLHQFRKQPPAIRNLQKQQFNEGMFDVNGDGVIDIEEAKMARQLDRQTNFTEIDIDGDGEV